MRRSALRFRLRPAPFLLLAAMTGGATLADAQDLVRNPTTGETERVVITGQSPEAELPALESTTATRLPARILDTPRSVGVVNLQTLDDRQVDDPQEAVQNVSGVVRSGSFTGAGETYNVRGFFQTNLFKDGFRAGSTTGGPVIGVGGNTDVANLERVEVLKGPAAILYGRGAPGGLVNYVTTVPYFGTDFRLEQQVGSYDYYRTQVNANWQAVPNKVAVHVDAAYETNESFTDYVDGRRVFVAPSLLWQIAPRTTLTLRGEYSFDDRSTNPGLPYIDGRVLPGVPFNRYFGETDFTRLESRIYRGLLVLDHQWNDWAQTTLSVHGRRGDSNGGYFLVFDFLNPALQDPVTGNIGRAATPVDLAEENLDVRLDQLFTWTIYRGAGGGQEAAEPKERTDGKAGKEVAETLSTLPRGGFPTITNQLLISPEYERQTNLSQRKLSNQAPLNPYNPQYTGYAPFPLFPGLPTRLIELTDAWADSYSLLIQDRLSIGEFAYLSFAERTEWFASVEKLTYVNTTAFPGANQRRTPYTFNPSAGLVIKPVRPLSLYFSYAESTNQFAALTGTTVNGTGLDPERARQYEFGAKAELLGGKLLATTSVFQINRTNVAATDPANPLFLIDAGEERSRGFEFDLNGEPLPGWRVILNYGYIDARIIDDPTGVNTGHRRYGVPENSGGFFTTYEFQHGPLRGFGLGGGMYFSDRVQIDTANSGQLSGYAQTDLAAFYHRGPFRAQFNVKNLFDNEFYYAQDQNLSVVAAPARMVIGSVAVKF